MKTEISGREWLKRIKVSMEAEDDIREYFFKAFEAINLAQEGTKTGTKKQTFKDYLIQTKKQAQNHLKDKNLLYTPTVYQHPTENAQFEWSMVKPSQSLNIPNLPPYGFHALHNYLNKIVGLKHDSLDVLLGEIIYIVDTLLNKTYKDENSKLADAFQLGIKTTLLEVLSIESRKQSKSAKVPRSPIPPIIKTLAKSDLPTRELWNHLINKLDVNGHQPRTGGKIDGLPTFTYTTDKGKKVEYKYKSFRVSLSKCKKHLAQPRVN